MTKTDFDNAYNECLYWLHVELLKDAKVLKSSLARGLVKSAYSDSANVRIVKSALISLILSGYKITKENLFWLLRDADLGYPDQVEMMLDEEKVTLDDDFVEQLNNYIKHHRYT